MELEKIIEVYEKSKIEGYRLGTELPMDVIDSEIHVKEVDAFCKVLSNLFEEKYKTYLARYLTTLIQLCKSKEMLLSLPIPLDSFGYGLTGKRLVINGELGNLAFMYARDCSIEIRGNVGERLGYISDSCQFRIIDENVGANPLENARNCKLELYKNIKLNKK